jgi:hypothetical protein
MIWKSNLNKVEQELIDDFGGKTSLVPEPTPKKEPASRPLTAQQKKAQSNQSENKTPNIKEKS